MGLNDEPLAIAKCDRCGGDLVGQSGSLSILADSLGRPVCGECRRKLHSRFAAALALLGLGVALSPVLVDMPVGLFGTFGGGLILIAGLVYWRARGRVKGGGWRVEGFSSTLHPPPSTLFHAAIFGPWFLAYYVANLACGEWNPLAVGCNGTCRTIMWGSLGSMAALATAYVMGYRKAIWPMLGLTVIQNYPHCQCANALYVPALGVQPFCLIAPTLVGLTNLWMMRVGTYKPLGFALALSLLAGAFAVAVTHRLGSPIAFGSLV